MITRSIEEVKLSSAIADELLPSITGDGFRGDNSWLATMRALLPSRLPDGAKVQLKLLVKETPSKKSRAARLEYYLDGVDTAWQQLRIALQKGGIRADEPYELARFEVVRHK